MRVRVAALVTLTGSVLALSPVRAAAPPEFSSLAADHPTAETSPLSLAAQGAMLPVPAGVYPIGHDGAAEASRPAHRVRLSAFAIDRTEVTNAAFAEFLNALSLDPRGVAGAGRVGPDHVAPGLYPLIAEGPSGSGRYPLIALDDAEARIGVARGRFVPVAGFEDHPVTETTWAGARAYCRWRGARLPSEAEWEAAARGPGGRLYPWGDAPPDASRAFVSKRTGDTAPVGGRPAGASPFGVLDLSGSLAEWTSTLRRPYPYDAGDGREDPRAPGERVTRGGDYRFDTQPERLTAVHRAGFSNAPERGHRHIGFRCALSLPPA